ncbi:metal ABC transporter substrate-binding protein [Conexibacter sp. CPCC 206217]|uniref:metal ABC transporter substrate-binding protein n=1 Tax=Conexibacter sp. CPCC 206217 TaxID=3064574 RepID=UPI0027191788|nr:metal ABC transporter substrate-binding protein [Conexibacter sp. CPCC 206217]MDO8209495.1 metal ABC transporter substrate-binding protein [Conexibacter sp. CPCC 206217]
MPRSRFRLVALTGIVVAGLAGCRSSTGDDARSVGPDGSVDVVATTTVLGDIAREVGGDAVSVKQLLRANSDPHDYEPRPHDVVAVAKAPVVLASGDGLDGWIDGVVDDSGSDPTVVDVAASLPVQRHDEGDGHDRAEDGHDRGGTDPHWWHDPTNVEAATALVRDALTRANPAGRAAYARNAAAYVAKLRALDAGIGRCLASVPASQRKLVTDHDALGYFADRYGIELVGAVIPSLTTQAQPSAGDVADLAAIIRREGVRAVFPESGSNSKLPSALADETGVSAEYQLYGDTLGPEDSDAATYIGMEAHNAEAIMRGFTDGARGCPLPGL